MIQEFMTPASIEEAVVLKKTRSGSLYFGGGTEINHAGSSKKSDCVISLEKLGLNSVEQNGNQLILGASVTLQELIDAPLVPVTLQKAARHIYSRNVRNMATLGGNIGANRSDSALIPCLIALSADLDTAEDGRISVEDYISGNKQSLILSVIVPKQKGSCVVKKVSKSSASSAIITVAVRIDGSWGNINGAVLAVGGIGSQIMRLWSVEDGLKSGSIKNRDELQLAVSNVVAPQTDVLGSVSYKKYICGVTVADCVDECMEVAL